VHACTEEVHEEVVAVVRCQAIVRLEELGFLSPDICGLEAGLLVEGMVDAGLPKEFPDGGVVQGHRGELCIRRRGVANVIAVSGEQEVVAIKHLTKCGCGGIVCVARVLIVVLPKEVHVIGRCVAWPGVGFSVVCHHIED
jgi:hypothetical protein